jgi:hypothetical protein
MQLIAIKPIFRISNRTDGKIFDHTILSGRMELENHFYILTSVSKLVMIEKQNALCFCGRVIPEGHPITHVPAGRADFVRSGIESEIVYEKTGILSAGG